MRSIVPSNIHVVFDLDDTLYPERQHAISGFQAAGNHAADTWGIEGLAEDMTRMLDSGHLGALFKMALAAKRPDHSEADLEALRAAYRDHQPDLTLFDDGQWALDHYAAKGPLGLITDGNAAVQSRKIAALGIAPYFKAAVLTGALGKPREFHKPHPRAYELIEQQLGAPGDHFIYIGDNPAKDFVTPNARGWTSIQVVRDQTIHDPHAVVPGGAPLHRISTLRELPDIIPL